MFTSKNCQRVGSHGTTLPTSIESRWTHDGAVKTALRVTVLALQSGRQAIARRRSKDGAPQLDPSQVAEAPTESQLVRSYLFDCERRKENRSASFTVHLISLDAAAAYFLRPVRDEGSRIENPTASVNVVGRDHDTAALSVGACGQRSFSTHAEE